MEEIKPETPTTTEPSEKTTQEVIPQDPKVVTREELIGLLVLSFNYAIKSVFKKDYLDVNELDVVRTALKTVDKKAKRFMRSSGANVK